MQPENTALHKSAWTTTSDTRAPPSFATDGNPATFTRIWERSMRPSRPFLAVDLGRKATLLTVALRLWNGECLSLNMYPYIVYDYKLSIKITKELCWVWGVGWGCGCWVGVSSQFYMQCRPIHRNTFSLERDFSFQVILLVIRWWLLPWGHRQVCEECISTTKVTNSGVAMPVWVNSCKCRQCVMVSGGATVTCINE